MLDDRIQSLLNTGRTRRQVGVQDVGDRWDVPVYNEPERLAAAEELATTGERAVSYPVNSARG